MARAQAAPRANSAAEPRFDWTEPARGAKRGQAAGRALSSGRRSAPRTAEHRPSAPQGERRRRAQHFRRRRRDLLVDATLALILTIVLLSLTAGLGILMLVVVPMAAGLIVHRIIQRRRARREAPRGRRSRGARPRPARG